MELENTNLSWENTHWQCCVLGNGVSALWLAHQLWSSKKSVLWITSEEPFGPGHAWLSRAWNWAMPRSLAEMLSENLTGFESGDMLQPFEAVYFDARAQTKRFKKLADANPRWGNHEKEYFERLQKIAAGDDPAVDLWNWHKRVQAFHLSGAECSGPSTTVLFNEPRFERVQAWPLAGLKTESGKLSSMLLSNLGGAERSNIEVHADHFYLGDYDEPLSALVSNETDAESLSRALKGRKYRSGFGLKLKHRDLESYPVQTAIIPLVVNPTDKNSGCHVIGRFRETNEGLESFWCGLLSDDDVEDNNEILKKIKLAKRAIERAIPGFSASIWRESVTFEPRMVASGASKGVRVLGAPVISDYYGAAKAALFLKDIFVSGVVRDEKNKNPHLRRTESVQRRAERDLDGVGP